jgi:hypothetical protein
MASWSGFRWLGGNGLGKRYTRCRQSPPGTAPQLHPSPKPTLGNNPGSSFSTSAGIRARTILFPTPFRGSWIEWTVDTAPKTAVRLGEFVPCWPGPYSEREDFRYP